MSRIASTSWKVFRGSQLRARFDRQLSQNKTPKQDAKLAIIDSGPDHGGTDLAVKQKTGAHVLKAAESISRPAAVRPVSLISGQAAARLSRQKSVAPPLAETPRVTATEEPSVRDKCEPKKI